MRERLYPIQCDLRDQIRCRGMLQTDVARKCKMSQSLLSDYINGYREFPKAAQTRILVAIKRHDKTSPPPKPFDQIKIIQPAVSAS